jgi:signal transduction histidine kinase
MFLIMTNVIKLSDKVDCKVLVVEKAGKVLTLRVADRGNGFNG